jgi:hypothetical protein
MVVTRGSSGYEAVSFVGGSPPQYRSVDVLAPLVEDWHRAVRRLHQSAGTTTPMGPLQARGTRRPIRAQHNAPFSAQEQVEIAKWAVELKRDTRETYGKIPDQLALLEAKLEYLCEAASRTGWIDWLNLAVGAVMGGFAGDLLAPNIVEVVLGALGSGLGSLFGHPIRLLGQ